LAVECGWENGKVADGICCRISDKTGKKWETLELDGNDNMLRNFNEILGLHLKRFHALQFWQRQRVN